MQGEDDAVLSLLLLCACDDDGVVDVGNDAIPAEYEAGFADEEAEAKAASRVTIGRLVNKPTTPGTAHAVAFFATLTMSIEYFDGSCEDFAVGVATGLGVPRDNVRVTGARARGCSVIVETSVTVDGGVQAAAAFASLLTDPANPLVDELEFGPCAVSGVRIEESAAAAAPAEAAPAKTPAEVDISSWRVALVSPSSALPPRPTAATNRRGRASPIANGVKNTANHASHSAEPAPPSAPAMANNKPSRVIDVVLHNDDDNRHPGEEIEGRDGGLWDYNVSHEDMGWSDDASATGVSDDDMTAPDDDASATGHTYDDITKAPPPHLRCVVSPLPLYHPVLQHTAASPPPAFCRRHPGLEAGFGCALREAVTQLFGA